MRRGLVAGCLTLACLLGSCGERKTPIDESLPSANIGGTVRLGWQNGQPINARGAHIALMPQQLPDACWTELRGSTLALIHAVLDRTLERGCANGERADARLERARRAFAKEPRNVTVLIAVIRALELESDPIDRGDVREARRILFERCAFLTRTDVDGRYRIEGVGPGDYLIFGQHEASNTVTTWLRPIELRGEDLVVELDGGNTFSIPW